ncbi:MAG: DUF4012 domain-containing protein [Patescibacteria group bacterium]|jgi:hypothetical protein
MKEETPNFLTCPVEPWPGDSPSPIQKAPKDKQGDSKLQIPKPPKKPRSWKVWVIVAVFLVIGGALLPAVIGGVRALLAVRSAQNAMTSAEQKIRVMDVAGAKTDVETAQSSLADLRTALRGMGYWRDVPGLGTQIRAVEDAAGAGSGTLDSASDLLEIASVIVDALQGGSSAAGSIGTGIAETRSFSELTREEKRDLLQKFANELPRLRLARDKMDLALELWSRVPQDQLASPIRKALAPLADTLPTLQRSLDEAVPIIEVIVPMAGYPTPTRYLMSLQNADEIRPAGGFIGTIGTMTWDAGDMSEFAFTDVYNIDNPVSGVWKETPPEPIKTYLGLDNWFLRDANWSPDFSVSAERILDFYIREAELQLHAQLPHRPDAYVALEPGFFESLLRLTGPIVVDGITFDADTFFEKIEYEVEVNWHQRGLPVEERKLILSRIGDALTKKLFSLPAGRWPEILDLMTDALERKQIMAYSRNQELQSLFDSRGWSARAKPTTGDFLWAIDANLAALKTDGAMKKEIHYSVNAKDPRGPVGTVTLRYTNTAKGFGDYRYTRYRSYSRVYVPEGAELLSSEGAMKDDLNKTGGNFIPGKVDVMKELGKTVYGAFWSIEPGKTRELSFTYRLPRSVTDGIQNGMYHLDWMKQPGVDDAGLTLDLSLGKNIMSATPSENEQKWGDARYEYETDSLTDRSFDIRF